LLILRSGTDLLSLLILFLFLLLSFLLGRRWRPTADWRCLAYSRVAAQACVCRLLGGGLGGQAAPVMPPVSDETVH